MVSLRTSSSGEGSSQTLGFDFFEEVSLSATPSGPPLPEELLMACERAMTRDPNDRYPSAGALAAEIEAWLEGAKKREQALKVVTEALATEEDTQDLREKAASLREQAEAGLKEIPSWESEEVKVPHWKLEEEAKSLEQLETLSILFVFEGTIHIDSLIPQVFGKDLENLFLEMK